MAKKWIAFVKSVWKRDGGSYSAAMKKAAGEWKSRKGKGKAAAAAAPKKKGRRKKKGKIRAEDGS